MHFSLASRLTLSLVPILFLMAAPSIAAPVTVGGITFSDERGEFTIREVTGSGSLTDPFVVLEDITGSEPMLVIRFQDERFSNRIGTRDPLGIAIVKLAINHSGTVWDGYGIEPRETSTLPSPDSDGLSLGQDWTARPPMASNGFRHAYVVDQPYDAIFFNDGRVEEGQTVNFSIILTGSIWESQIFLLQTPEADIACTWPQSTAAC